MKLSEDNFDFARRVKTENFKRKLSGYITVYAGDLHNVFVSTNDELVRPGSK